MSENKAKKNKEKKAVTDKRSNTLRLFSVASVCLVIAFVIVLNLIFENLLGNFTTFDLSATGQNSVSQATIDYLDSLPDDTNIRIVGLFEKPANIKDTPYEYIIPLLDDYQAKSHGKITVEYIDPQVYPSIISQLDPQGMFDLVSDTFAIACNNKVHSIDPIECFTIDPSYHVPTANAVEATFTSALKNLTDGYQYKAYFLSGLQEYTHEQFSKVLDAMGIESADLQASDSFEIPEDCDMIIISGINTDITENMSLKLKDYITHGGKMLVAVNYYGNNVFEDYENLNAVLHEMNLHIDPCVVSENDPQYQQGQGDAKYFLSLIDVTDSYASYATAGTKLRNGYARSVRSYDLPYSYISVTPILTTSSSATAVQYDQETGYVTQFNNQGQYNVAMFATYPDSSNPPALYVFGTLSFTADDYIATYGYNDANIVFIRNIIRSMLVDKDEVVVDVKPISNYTVDVNKVNAQVISAYSFILMVVVPLGFVIAGTVVYNKRKNL